MSFGTHRPSRLSYGKLNRLSIIIHIPFHLVSEYLITILPSPSMFMGMSGLSSSYLWLLSTGFSFASLPPVAGLKGKPEAKPEGKPEDRKKKKKNKNKKKKKKAKESSGETQARRGVPGSRGGGGSTLPSSMDSSLRTMTLPRTPPRSEAC